MKKFDQFKTSAFLIASLFVLSAVVKAQVSVLTQHNDLKRTGWNANETILNQNNVNSNSFGKLISRRLDDQVYAQPLVVSNLNINGKVRNVVFVVTLSNTLYAFDADDASVYAPLWYRTVTKSGFRPLINSDLRCGDIRDNKGIGVVGTPVVDTTTKTLYLVARSASYDGKTFVQYLLAIDIITGEIKNWVLISPTVPGTGTGSVNGQITFDALRENQRPGLLLYNGVVYIAWASHCDAGPYHGWVVGYDARTLQQKYVYNNTPYGQQGGIWMSGQAPAVDENGYIYIASGNGTVGVTNNPNDLTNRGESIVKLSTASGNLKVVDFFTPENYDFLEAHDQDYGSDGVLLIPNTNLSLSGSKEGKLFLVNNNNMGHITAKNSGAVQQINVYTNSTRSGTVNIHGTPAYYKAPNGQEYIYVWAENGLLKQMPFNRTTMKFDTAKTTLGLTQLPAGMPGSMLSVSSNQQTAGTGIVWATHPLSGDANKGTVPGILQAFDATNVTRELWNSNMVPSRDSVGNLAKFVCPTIANGKVYLATFSNQLDIYGLLPAKSAIAKTSNSTTSISSDAKLTLSPNPAHRQVTIEYVDHNAIASEKASLDIYGSTGNTIYHQDVVINNGGILHLNITLPSIVPNGVYTVRIMNEKGVFKAGKLVISN